MKKLVFPVTVAFVLGIFSLTSCSKNYHCQCSYQNTIKLTKDLGHMVKGDAETACSSYDTTVTGEKWNCVLY